VVQAGFETTSLIYCSSPAGRELANRGLQIAGLTTLATVQTVDLKSIVMNFQSEQNKPLFVVRNVQVRNFSAERTMNDALASNTAVHAERVDDFMVKSAAAKRLPREILVKVADASPVEIKELVIRRLKADAAEKFEFVDGHTFTGVEAATEVERESAMGRYFLALEKETLRIAQQAHFDGKL
jgi:hypothetical protein